MKVNIDKVRYSRAGHDFHLLWTSRRSLQLLNPKSDLVAVSIEGISPEEEFIDEKGLLSIDTAEYDTSENIAEASKIRYFQLKYSTTDSTKEWTASTLSPRQKNHPKGTINSFAKKFKENIDKYGVDFVLSKYEYYFVTNRPIDDNIKKLLKLNRKNKLEDGNEEFTQEIQKIYKRFLEDSELIKEEFHNFLLIFDFLDTEDTRYYQEQKLNQEINDFIPSFDMDVSIKLKELINSRAMPEYENDPVIRKETVFYAFGITKLEDILPAQSSFNILENYIHRVQEREIAKCILESKYPVVIHASGGVGKSSFAQNLSYLMPKNSKCVIFDGFANGAYRSPKDQRHLHKNGLIQIINEFAIQGLCLPLLPRNTTTDELLKAFYNRLEQIVFEVKSHDENSIVIIILDAADNTQTAALEFGLQSSFSNDLLGIPLPNGCKIVALSRTERLNILNLKENVLKIKLNSMTFEETKEYLQSKFKNILDKDIESFNKFTFGNPRVQSYLLDSGRSLNEIIKLLGHKGLSCEDLIELQIEQHLNNLQEQQVYKKEEINLLCESLAILPPMVPMDILAKASNIDKSLIVSFSADLGLALFIKGENDSIQFRDEPVETWFKKRFKATKNTYELLSSRLYDLKDSNPYVAITIPRLLYGAKRYDDLYNNIYSNNLDITDPIQRQSIIIENVTYSIKIASQQKDFLNLNRLLLELSKVLSIKDRGLEFIFNNADLIATLVGPEFINDFLYREKQIDKAGIIYASSALMLSMNPLYHSESRIFLRLTQEFLKEWVNYSNNERYEHRIENRDRANITLAYLYTEGIEKAVYELNRWLDDSVKFESIKIVIQHLIEHQKISLIEELLNYTSLKNINMMFAIMVQLHHYNLPVSKKIIFIALRTLQKIKSKIDNTLLETVIQLALKNRLNKKSILKLITKYLPKGEIHKISYNYEDRGRLFLFYHVIYKLLKDETLDLKDFINKDSEDSKQYFLKALFHIYKLYGEIISQRKNLLKEEYIEEIKQCLSKSSVDEWRFENNYNLRDIPYIITYITTDILLLIDSIEHYSIVLEYLKKRKNYVPHHVFINIAQKILYKDKNIALKFIQEAYNSTVSIKIRSQDSNNLVELARAILPISKVEAQAYFELALESNLNLGDDARARLNLLCNITNKLDRTDNCPKLAYEFLRVSELVYHFDGHKFQWDIIINAIYNIDTHSSLAIASRLKDRNIVDFYETLAEILNKLLQDNYISAQTFTSMIILIQNYGYGFHKSIKILSKKDIDNDLFTSLISKLIKNMLLENNGIDSYYIKKIQNILKEKNIKNKDIDFYLEYNEEDAYKSNFEKDDDVIDWDNIFKQFDCLTSENIQEAYHYFRENTKYVDHIYFFKEMRKRINFDNRKHNLDSFVNCDYGIKIIIEQIAEYYEDWKDSVAIRKYIPKLIENIFLNQSGLILNSYWLGESLNIAVKLTGKSRTNLILILLEKGLENIQSYSYETILRLVNEFKNLITSEETKELLTFGIEQFKEDLEDDSSDGIWQDNLIPPSNINDTLGAFIYIALGSTKAEDRWRTMYTIRMLCEFEEKEIINSILRQLENYNISFIDKHFKFYDLHAKQYLFIALARVALDDSKILRPYSNIFKYYSIDWLSHALIRKYCVDIALLIEKQFPKTYTLKDLEEIKQKTISKFPKQIITRKGRYSKKRVEVKRYKRLRFGIDWEPYWFEYLANAFSISISDISQMIENLIIDDWGYDEKFEHWDYDLRSKYKIFEDDMKTNIWKSYYPKQDRLSFYITYHAMFCVAGKLFDNNPIFYDEEYEDNLWEDFLSRHTLTRRDNKWVSDRKDFFPTNLYRDYKELLKDNNWQFSVTHNDFDKVLRFKENDFQYLPIYGSWEYSNEEISIESVFVNETSSHALLRALQTVENPRDFYLAPDQDRRIVQKDQFEMFGVIENCVSLDLKLDQFDSLAKIRYPGIKPAEYIIKKFELQSDVENRIWKNAQTDVFISELWSDRGKRLQVNYDSLLYMLSVMKKDLLVNVEIKREKRSYHITYDSDKIYYPPYFKLYLFKKDGTIHELYKNYKIR
ncbi:F0F1 ATP synthase subunit delta [Aliarcobacter vitoriensis]|uniref:ATP-binding protein n=1 Tax=Aliarcobacter vitoriensis TaxID=2011099 RepID=A0A366MT89_9BACT|nr:hypothetical protein [Aliarcobacter vitoriensis]RBQ29471.1 hypothetical protein CRU91_03835 [Aliarcobacter vitoriensis]